MRRAIDLEHWAAFRASFERLALILREVAAGRRGSAPASIVILSGDVHYGYLAQAEFPGHPVDSRVYQAVCSPFRHPLEAALERANRMAFRRTVARIGRLLVSATRQRTSGLTWRIKFGPYFANQVAMLELRGRAACLRFEGTPDTEARLDRVAEERLS